MATKKKKVEMCVMNGCDRHAECPQSQLCKRCYAWLHYQMANSFTVTDLMKRLNKYDFWNKRLSGFIGGKKRK